MSASPSGRRSIRPDRLRLLLVDDHVAVREALRRCLEAVPRFQVVGEAGDIAQALEQLGATSPHLAVIDIGLGKESGLSLARMMREQHPETRVLIWSMHDKAEYVAEARDAGARGYVPKSHSTEEVVRAIERVSGGECYYPGGIDHVSPPKRGARDPEPADSPGEHPPPRIGDHDIIGELGCGGMGVVYRARHRTNGRVAALKMLRAGQLPTPEELRRFRIEIEAVAALDHPNIIAIYDVDEHEGRPFYTMRLCADSLDKQLSCYRDPTAAAGLVEKVARAVHHAHERGVLHRDLHPANILLDHDQPYVSDFGAAKRISDQGGTTALDVYSLGVILYQLLTGELPFKGDPHTSVPAMREIVPVRPRVLAPKVPRDLETICLKCLERDPAKRYRSAEALAADLERFRRLKPIEARPSSLAGRAWRFVRRHPLAVGTILLLATLAATAILVARAQERELQRDALRTNAYAAHAFAGAVAFHLREQIDAVVAAAADPALARLDLDRDALEQRRIKTPFEGIALADTSGRLIMGAPLFRRIRLGNDYSWRDYFLGARKLGLAGERAGYISLAFQSEDDDRYKFAVAAPIYDAGKWVGILMATIGTDFALRQKRLDHATEAGPMAVVVAPQDRSRHNLDDAGKYIVMRHEGLASGAGIVIDSPRLRELRVNRTEPKQLRWIDPEPITDDAHRDPVPGYEGRWLAGFAPVGDTGLVVIVQTRYDAAVAPNARLWRIGQVGGLLLMSVMLGMGLWSYVRRRRRRAIPAAARC